MDARVKPGHDGVDGYAAAWCAGLAVSLPAKWANRSMKLLKELRTLSSATAPCVSISSALNLNIGFAAHQMEHLFGQHRAQIAVG